MKKLIQNKLKFLSFILTFLFSQITFAAPILVDMNYFSGAETILTFDELTEDQVITSKYATQGIDFSNSQLVSASTSSGQPNEAWHFFNNPGNAVLQNFQNDLTGYGPPLVIDFTLSQQLIGLDVFTDIDFAVFSITSALNGNITTFNLNWDTPESFFGFYDPNGISQLIINTNADFIGVNAIAINDLRFETVASVPLPPGILLFLSGLALIYRKKNTNKIT